MNRVLPVLLLAGCLAVPAGGAEVRVVEALGAAPVDPSGGSRRSPRDEALRRALREAVWRIAIEELDAAAVAPADEEVLVALGDDPLVYATRFRIVENRGERPALFSDDPEVENEYVVLAKVHVDADRVRQRLASAGLMRLDTGEGPRIRTRLALVEVRSWAEIQAVRTLLREVGAGTAVPVDLVRGRAVLAVESTYSPEALVDALLAAAPPELRLERLGAGPDGLELRAHFLGGSGSLAPRAPAAAGPLDPSLP